MKVFFVLLFISAHVLAQDCVNCARGGYFPPLLQNLPAWPLKLIDIKKVNYRRAKVEYCKRPPEIVDTIVLHHSNTPTTTTPNELNEMHLERTSDSGAWMMIGYSFVVNSPYSGRTGATYVSEGRPLDIVGAHTGSDIYVPMRNYQKQALDQGKILCGIEGKPFVRNPRMQRGNSILANASTIGMVVAGNYAPFNRQTNPTGYTPGNPIYPSVAAIDAIARASCQLQKKYPRIKSIKWHSYYHPTDCPGTIKQAIPEIINRARRYGCEFSP